MTKTKMKNIGEFKGKDGNSYKPSVSFLLRNKNYSDLRNGVYDNRAAPSDIELTIKVEKMTEKEQIIIDGVDLSGCPISKKCKEFATCKIKNILRQLACKTQECEELYKEKMKLIDKSIKQKSKIRKLIEENAIEEVTYKINGKCAKTVTSKVKEMVAILGG